jgi:hypothetical protein
MYQAKLQKEKIFMYQHAIALTGIPGQQAYKAMATYVSLPDYASLSALLQASRTWDGPPARAHVEWQHLVVEHLQSASSFQASFVGDTPPGHIPQRYGLLCFPAPPSLAEPHAPGTHQVWLTCPFGDSADPSIQLVFDADLFGFATWLKEGKRDLAKVFLSHLFAARDFQQLPSTLPDISEEQAAPFAGYEIAELRWDDGSLDVRFSLIA